MGVEDHSVSLEETIVPDVSEGVDLIRKVIGLPTLKNLREKYLIGFHVQEKPMTYGGCETYRGSLYITAKGLMEQETWTEYYTTPNPVDFPYVQNSKARGVPEREIWSMLQKYSVNPDTLRTVITSIEERIESE